MTTSYIYYGTTETGENDGLFCQAFDAATGDLGELKGVAKGPSTGFQAISLDRTILYSMCQSDEGLGGVRSYYIDGTSGELSLISEEFSIGGKPCYIGLDRSEKFLLVASYNDAVVTVFPIAEGGQIQPYSFTAQHEGGTGIVADRQGEAHTHSIYADPTNRYVFVCDLGNDEVVVYRFDSEKGTLIPVDGASVAMAPGAGPRHLAFHPNGDWVYVINELDSTVTHFLWNADQGKLVQQGTVPTLPADFEGDNLTAEIIVSQDGRFVYGSNRGHDSIVVYLVNQETGALSFVQRTSVGGGHPRNFSIDPSGAFLVAANRDTDNVVFFRIDGESGQIEATGVEVAVKGSICVRFA